MTPALALLALPLCIAAARPGESDLTVEVEKKGNVTWQGDCTVDITPKSADVPAPPQTKPDVDVSLPPGSYDVAVTCGTTEGPVKKVVGKKLGARNEVLKVVLDPGFLLVKVLRFDSPVAAEITFFDVEGHELARSKERAVTLLPAGKVRVVAKVDDAKAGRPVLGNTEATVVAQRKSEVIVDTTDGTLTLSLTDNGKKADGVGWLRLPGDATHLVELRAGEAASVPPGSYELVTQLQDAHDFHEVVTKNVAIKPAQKIARTVNHTTASVSVSVSVDGKPAPKDARIDIELYQPGAPQPFNTVALGDKLKLKPGALEIAAVRKEPKLDDDTVLSQRKTVKVGGGAAASFDLRAATLDVTTSVGKKPRALDVALRPPGNDATRTLAQKKTDENGKVRFVLAPQTVVVNATLKAAQGEVTTQKQLALKGGSTMGLALDLDVGTALVQVFAKGTSVPAEVRFLEIDKAGTVASEPMLALPAGQEAILPPGTYALVIKRKGKETRSEPIKVSAGALVERTVEVPE
jgi:hypothetical protein